MSVVTAGVDVGSTDPRGCTPAVLAAQVTPPAPSPLRVTRASGRALIPHVSFVDLRKSELGTL